MIAGQWGYRCKRAWPVFAFVLFVMLSACAPLRKPVTPGDIPSARPLASVDEQYGHEVLQQLAERYPLDFNDSRYDMLVRVVKRLTSAANADRDPWHVYLFRAPEVKNAAATRGNHIFIWSGMLDIAPTEEEVATILAHEISHVLAGHTEPNPREQVTKILIQVGAIAAGTAVAAATRNPALSNTFGQLTSSATEQVGSGLLLYPYSREMEIEADTIGLFVYAKSGYNPENALAFWRRVQGSPEFSNGPEFLSTHPDTSARIVNLEKYLPQAKLQYLGHATQSNIGVNNLDANLSKTPQGLTKDDRSYQAQHVLAAPPERISRDRGSVNPVAGAALTQRADSAHLWQITIPDTVVFEQPDERSSRILVLKPGESVGVVRLRGRWLEVSSPAKGYIQSFRAEPIGK